MRAFTTCTTAFVLYAALLLFSPNVYARPYRGPIRWAVLLCKFKQEADQTLPYIPGRLAPFYEDMLVRPNTGGLEHYWNQVSYGGVTMAGTPVKGWYTMPYRLSEAAARPRVQRWQDCINAALLSGYMAPIGSLIMVVTYPAQDLFGIPGKGAYLSYGNDLGYFAHETGHGLGLEHSFSNNVKYQNADWSMPGEYDDRWDTMSFAAVWTTPSRNASFGSTGPSLNVYNMDRMGWMPHSKIYRFGAQGETDITINLQAHNTYDYTPNLLTDFDFCVIRGDCVTTYLMARIPFDANDPFHYYTVSYRMKQGLDSGLPTSWQLLIHEVKKFVTTGDGGRTWYSPVLYRNMSIPQTDPNRYPAQTRLDDPATGVRIDLVTWWDNIATIRIRSNYAKGCVVGYVWREAIPGDFRCVTGEDRAITRAENAAASANKLPDSDNCKFGFVWREAAGPADKVCVTGESRTRNQIINAMPTIGRSINKAANTWGPNTCKAGYVWRQADNRDWVCVTGATRDQVQADNSVRSNRWVPNGAYGKYTCIAGYVWREAFPSDYVCVLAAQRTQAAADNAAAQSRLELVIA